MPTQIGPSRPRTFPPSVSVGLLLMCKRPFTRCTVFAEALAHTGYQPFVLGGSAPESQNRLPILPSVNWDDTPGDGTQMSKRRTQGVANQPMCLRRSSIDWVGQTTGFKKHRAVGFPELLVAIQPRVRSTVQAPRLEGTVACSRTYWWIKHPTNEV